MINTFKTIKKTVLVAVVMLVVFSVGVFAMDSGTRQVDFAESTQQRQSKTITIDRLKDIKDITVDNGDVSYVVNGDEVTITVDNGDISRTEFIYDTKVISDSRVTVAGDHPDTLPMVIYFNQDGFTGTLYKLGSPFVISGVEGNPLESKTVTVYGQVRWWFENYWMYPANHWEILYSAAFQGPSTMAYNQDGFTGTLTIQGPRFNGENIFDYITPWNTVDLAGNPWVIGPGTGWGGGYNWLEGYFYDTEPFTGVVTRPATADTRVWQQNYEGTVQRQTGRADYFLYQVTIEYEQEALTSDVKVLHVNEQGEELHEPVILTGIVDEEFTTEHKEIEGHTLKEVVGATTGVFTEERQTVTYIYAKDDVLTTESDTSSDSDKADDSDSVLPIAGSNSLLWAIITLIGLLSLSSYLLTTKKE